VGPIAGRVSSRWGNGVTMMGGAVLIAAGLLISIIPSLWAVGIALAAVCTGYFGVHASAVSAVNQSLDSGRGRANALYVLFYYVGGWMGITGSGMAYSHSGWPGVVMLCLALLIIPLYCGIAHQRSRRPQVSGNRP